MPISGVYVTTTLQNVVMDGVPKKTLKARTNIHIYVCCNKEIKRIRKNGQRKSINLKDENPKIRNLEKTERFCSNQSQQVAGSAGTCLSLYP